MKGPFAFFRTGPDRPRISDDPKVISRLFEKRRWSIFLAATIGYGIFYVGRVNFSVVKRPILDAGLLSTSEMGYIGSAMLITYAIGKFTNGFLADRANIRRYMSFGLAATAIVNLILGFNTAFIVFVGLWGINGWFQSMGAPSSIVSMSNWFSQKERGTRYGIWSISHSIGEGLTFYGTAMLVGALGWRWGFWGPAILCGVGAFLLTRFLFDRPETEGLPPVSEYRNDPAPAMDQSKSVTSLQLEVLRTPAIWVLGLGSAMMYVARYGINNWGVLFLQDGKGYSLQNAGALLAVYAVFAVAGSFLSGIISDKFFGAHRNLPALLFGIIQIASLSVLLLSPPGLLWLDVATLVIFGFAMGVLISFLGGLMAIDIVSPRCAGAAAGIVGMFSYVGAAIQDTISGTLLDSGKVVKTTAEKVSLDGLVSFLKFLGTDLQSLNIDSLDSLNLSVERVTYSFEGVIAFWLGASVLSAILPLLVWNAGKNARIKREGGAVTGATV